MTAHDSPDRFEKRMKKTVILKADFGVLTATWRKFTKTHSVRAVVFGNGMLIPANEEKSNCVQSNKDNDKKKFRGLAV